MDVQQKFPLFSQENMCGHLQLKYPHSTSTTPSPGIFQNTNSAISKTPRHALRPETYLVNHLRILKSKCLQSLNILKISSHPSKGCGTKLLTQLYKSLIRSRLDYGAHTYNPANTSVLSLLDTIQTSSLRLALGAF